jgi:hypothetical protein
MEGMMAARKTKPAKKTRGKTKRATTRAKPKR